MTEAGKLKKKKRGEKEKVSCQTCHVQVFNAPVKNGLNRIREMQSRKSYSSNVNKRYVGCGVDIYRLLSYLL